MKYENLKSVSISQDWYLENIFAIKKKKTETQMKGSIHSDKYLYMFSLKICKSVSLQSSMQKLALKIQHELSIKNAWSRLSLKQKKKKTKLKM